MSCPEDEEEPIGGIYTNNVSIAMDEWFKDKDALLIDGIMMSVGDCRKIANEWKGSKVSFTEMYPTKLQTFELAKWKGKELRLSTCGGWEKYDLANFIEIMNDWEGETLTIGYCGPKIFKNVVEAFKNPKYKTICFESCDFPNNFIENINKNVPELTIIVK